MARTYKRDSIGRFAGGGGGSSGGGKRPAAKTVSRGVNRLTRDNAGKITSVGGNGATARGGRLKTAAGNKRATVTAKGIKRSSPTGAIRKTDVLEARVYNAISKNIEARNKNGLNKPVRETQNSTTRQAAAVKRIARQKAAGKVGQGKAAAPTPKPATAVPKPAATAKSRAAKPAAAAARTAAPKPAAVPNLATKPAGTKAPDNERTRANRLRTTQNLVKYRRTDPDSKAFSDAVKSRNTALAARTKGTGGRVNFRSKGQAVSRQNYRANDVTGRVRENMRMFGGRPGNFSKQTGAANGTAMKRTDTGMRQPSLFGPATKLYSTKTVKVKRKSGKRKP